MRKQISIETAMFLGCEFKIPNSQVRLRFNAGHLELNLLDTGDVWRSATVSIPMFLKVWSNQLYVETSDEPDSEKSAVA